MIYFGQNKIQSNKTNKKLETFAMAIEIETIIDRSPIPFGQNQE